MSADDQANSQAIVEGHSRFALGQALVTFQVALALVFVMGAGLMGRTFSNLASVDLGFSQNHLLLVLADLSRVTGSSEQLYLHAEEIRKRLGALPGVLSASFSDVTPISGVAIFPQLEVEGSASSSQQMSSAWTTSVSQDYFKTLGVPLIAGRTFDESDLKGSHLVAIVNEALAARFLGGTSPIGRFLRTGFIESGQPLQIIGLSRDAKYLNLREGALPTRRASRLDPMTALRHES